jgi:hypothetical protein
LIARKARSYDRWHFVSTTAPSHKHGLCNCDSAYFNTLGLSVLQQGDPYGTAHPNRAGHERIFKTALVPALTREIKEIKKHYAIERAKDLAREKAEAKVARANKKAAHPVFTSKISAGPAVTPVSADTAAKAKATAANAPPPADAPDNRTQEEGG